MPNTNAKAQKKKEKKIEELAEGKTHVMSIQEQTKDRKREHTYNHGKIA